MAPKKPPQSVRPKGIRVVIPEPLLDSEEAASIVRVHPKTLQKWARHGRIRGVHAGKLWRFPVSAIEEWIARQLAS
jgi:excisionase family DNA binding protein